MSAPVSQPRPAGKLAAFTEAEKLEAKRNLQLAGYLAHLSGGDEFICPACRVSHVKDGFSLKEDRGTWKCWKTGESGDAISIVMEALGYSFPDAVNVLLGRPIRTAPGKSEHRPIPKVLPPIPSKPSFEAVVDHEVYAAVRDFSGDAGVEAAQAYYGRWHIAPGAVTEAGAAVVLDPRKMERDLTKRFGIERLKACGLVMVTERGKDYFLCNRDYPVIEAHITPAGKIVGMQFRPSPQQMVKVQAHKAWKKRRDAFLAPHLAPYLAELAAWDTRGVAAAAAGEKFTEAKPIQPELPEYPEEKVPYVAAFLSLLGAGPDSLVGCGLVRLWNLPPDSDVNVVEGFKDLLAARTMGTEAFGIPGTSGMPSDKVCEVLKRHKLAVALDGDAGGNKSRGKVVTYFTERGIRAHSAEWMPEGLDVTDILVRKWARSGCACDTCTEWRAGHPEDALT